MTTKDARISRGILRSLVPPKTSPFEAVPGPKTAVGRLARGAERCAPRTPTRPVARERRAALDAFGRAAGTCPDGAAAPRSPSRPQPSSASRRCGFGNGVRAATFRREVPPTGRRRRAPVGRGARLESLRQPSAPHRSSRAARRSRLTSATRRLPPHRAARPLSSNRSPGTPLARSVFGLSERAGPFRAQFFAAARRAGTRRRPATSAASQRAADGRASQNLVSLH